MSATLHAIDPARAAFLAERKRGIGGSDVAALMGLDSRKTPYQLWREKVGIDDDTAAAPAAARRGRFLEPAIIARYAALLAPAALETPVRHDGDWRRGNQDARAVSADGVRRVVEAKSVTRRVFRDEWGAPWSDEIPDRALCQGLWYGALDDADIVDFAVCVIPDDPDEVLGLSPDEVLQVSDFHVFQAPRRPDVEQMLVERAGQFWRDHVLARVAPDPIPGAGDVGLMWPEHTAGKTKPAEPIFDLLREYAELSAATRDGAKRREKLRDRIIAYAEDSESLVGPDGRSPWFTIRTESRAAHSVAASKARTLRTTKWWAKHNPTPQPMENET